MGAFLIALGVAALGTGIWAAVNQKNYNEESLKQQEEQLQAQVESDYYNAVSDLEEMQGTYDELVTSQIPQAEANIDSINSYLSRWQEEYDTQVDTAELEISQYDEFLNNWGDVYDQQMEQARMEGENQYDALMQNWANTEVVAADRGMGGSMALIAEQERGRVEDYAGSDLSLAGDDGLYGLSIMNLRTSLQTERVRAEDTKSILESNLDSLKLNLEAEKTTQENQLGIWENTLDTHKKTKNRLKGNLDEQEERVEELKKEAGL
jgi:hypothetical protein